MERGFARLGSEIKEIHPIAESGDADSHVLAGDILSPQNTQTVKEIILGFIETLR